MKLKFTPVKSSQIKGELYDENDKKLFLHFKSKRIYSYWPVTKEMYGEFLAAESQGKYFHKNLKANKELVILDVTKDVEQSIFHYGHTQRNT
jgi:hypothetical protein